MYSCFLFSLGLHYHEEYYVSGFIHLFQGALKVDNAAVNRVSPFHWELLQKEDMRMYHSHSTT